MNPTIGIDIGGSKMRILQRWGSNSRYEVIPTSKDTHPCDLEFAIGSFLGQIDGTPAGVGISIPGLIENGKVVCSDSLPHLKGWVPGRALRGFLTNSCPIIVLNDAEAAAREAMVGSVVGETIVMIMVGTGVGLAMVIDGQLFRGAKGWAGEFGALPLYFEGSDQRLNDVAGGAALQRHLGGDLDGAHRLLVAGDKESCGIVARSGRALGFALGGLINLMNPNRIILAGGTLRYPGYLNHAMDATRRWALPELYDSCRIELPADGDTLPARGAATAAQEQIPN